MWMWSTECGSFLVQSSRTHPCNSPQHWIFSTQKDCKFHFLWFDYPGKEQQSSLCSGKMGLKKMMRIWVAAPKHSRCIHDTLDISIANSNWVQCNHAEIYHALASMEGKQNHQCCMILCNLVWLINQKN